MKRLLIAILLIPILVVVVFFALGLYSTGGKPPGLINGKLAPCPQSPNCVSSETATSDSHAVAALPLPNSESPMNALRKAIEMTGGSINENNENYLAATYTSGVFKFVDDVELRLDTGSNLVHIRSASRVGYSDLGSNKKRVEKIRQALK